MQINGHLFVSSPDKLSASVWRLSWSDVDFIFSNMPDTGATAALPMKSDRRIFISTSVLIHWLCSNCPLVKRQCGVMQNFYESACSIVTETIDKVIRPVSNWTWAQSVKLFLHGIDSPINEWVLHFLHHLLLWVFQISFGKLLIVAAWMLISLISKGELVQNSIS